MAPITTMSDFGLNTDDIRYFKMDAIIRGNGPNRLKYLDLEGRWSLSGKSMPYISAAFNNLERLNYARVPFRDISDQPLNALGMVGWTPSSTPVESEKVPERKPVAKFKLPVPVLVEDEVPPSPREDMPHRTVGYGLAHQKRKLSVPDRSRSVSPMRTESPAPTYDKYAKYERNRTVSPYKEELRVLTRESKKAAVPYRSGGYGAYHEKRQYDISPRSIGSTGDYTSGSEQSSPASNYDRSADEIVLMTYHSKKTIGTSPRRDRQDWIRH